MLELPNLDDLDLDALLAEVPQAGYAEVLAAAEAKMEQILGPEPGAAPEAPKKRRGRPPKTAPSAGPAVDEYSPEHREAAAHALGYESAGQRDEILAKHKEVTGDEFKFPEEKPNNAIAPPPNPDQRYISDRPDKAYAASLADSDPWLALLAGVQDQMRALEEAIMLLVSTVNHLQRDREGRLLVSTAPSASLAPSRPPEPPIPNQDGAIGSGPGGVTRFKETSPGVFLPT